MLQNIRTAMRRQMRRHSSRRSSSRRRLGRLWNRLFHRPRARGQIPLLSSSLLSRYGDADSARGEEDCWSPSTPPERLSTHTQTRGQDGESPNLAAGWQEVEIAGWREVEGAGRLSLDLERSDRPGMESSSASLDSENGGAYLNLAIREDSGDWTPAAPSDTFYMVPVPERTTAAAGAASHSHQPNKKHLRLPLKPSDSSANVQIQGSEAPCRRAAPCQDEPLGVHGACHPPTPTASHPLSEGSLSDDKSLLNC